ncbi:MAG: response regulator transcription factor [SAR202 cluster bacterium]|jgi:DNA-binding NarL/FixJ family response regulator|nr:response regulator transcription factor [SAR202 cluster bacterium]MDP6713180.1 response regulator transcription factor [SAR202 cluster bacterium]
MTIETKRIIKVVIVDDHPMFRAGAIASLKSQDDFEVVGEAANAPDAPDALELISNHEPDVVLTDIRLDGPINGIELSRRVRSKHPDVRLVVLTNYSNEPYIRAMMNVGVEAYMLKDTKPREVIDSLRMVVDGQTVYSSAITRVIMRGYLSGPQQNGSNADTDITAKEAEVLQLLARGEPNRGIANLLNVTVSGVQFHLTNIYGKLGVSSRSEAIVEAAREGLVVIDE